MLIRELIYTYLNKIKKTMLDFVVRLIISLLNRLLGGEFRKSHILQYRNIVNSNLFGRNLGFDINEFYKIWGNAFSLDAYGYFTEACKLRIDLLSKISDMQNISPGDGNGESPKFMSHGWVNAIGHLGHLGAFRIGQQLGLIENNPRDIIVKKEEELTNIKRFFNNHFYPLNFKYGISLFENPVNWHNIENLHMLRTKSGFMTYFELSDLAFGHQKYDPKINKLYLDDTYLNRARQILQQRGLPDDSWFVGLHIREKPNKKDARNASVFNFIPAIKEITKRGGWVIRFGTDNMTPLPNLPNLIDLNFNSLENRSTHYFILAYSRFLLGNLSGPMEMARSFGTPVVITNMVGIGKNMFKSPSGSLFLPKLWLKNGQKVSYEELVNNHEGFSEMDLQHRYKRGYELLENTKSEIRNIVIDFFDNNFGKLNNESVKLDLIRKHYKVIANGRIAPSYLIENDNWFLKTERFF